MPRVASQNAYDMQSYTKWTIEVNESLLGRRMRTATAVVVLEEIGRLLGRYGPANLVFSVKERYVTLSVGFLGIMEFGEGDGDGGVQTS